MFREEVTSVLAAFHASSLSWSNWNLDRVCTLIQKQNSRTFQESDWFFKASKIHINPYTPKISMLILVTAFHTLQIFQRSLTDFQNFPGPVTFFQDFLVLENVIIKFQDFPGFPGPVRTLFGMFSFVEGGKLENLKKNPRSKARRKSKFNRHAEYWLETNKKWCDWPARNIDEYHPRDILVAKFFFSHPLLWDLYK